LIDLKILKLKWEGIKIGKKKLEENEVK